MKPEELVNAAVDFQADYRELCLQLREAHERIAVLSARLAAQDAARGEKIHVCQHCRRARTTERPWEHCPACGVKVGSDDPCYQRLLPPPSQPMQCPYDQQQCEYRAGGTGSCIRSSSVGFDMKCYQAWRKLKGAAPPSQPAQEQP